MKYHITNQNIAMIFPILLLLLGIHDIIMVGIYSPRLLIRIPTYYDYPYQLYGYSYSLIIFGIIGIYLVKKYGLSSIPMFSFYYTLFEGVATFVYDPNFPYVDFRPFLFKPETVLVCIGMFYLCRDLIHNKRVLIIVPLIYYLSFVIFQTNMNQLTEIIYEITILITVIFTATDLNLFKPKFNEEEPIPLITLEQNYDEP